MKAISKINKGLIVSCQALENEPLYSSFIMGRMAKAAQLGGAVGIRANGYKDIVEIKKQVSIPIIGIVKKTYEGYEPYITPTMKEVREVFKAGADIVAVDATKRLRPGNIDAKKFLKIIKKEFPDKPVMADISTFEEGIDAYEMGFDLVSTTLAGYTEYSNKISGPDFTLISRLSKNIKIPLIAEGRIWSPEDAANALKKGAYAVVVGTAITRPKEITQRFVTIIKGEVGNG